MPIQGWRNDESQGKFNLGFSRYERDQRHDCINTLKGIIVPSWTIEVDSGTLTLRVLKSSRNQKVSADESAPSQQAAGWALTHDQDLGFTYGGLGLSGISEMRTSHSWDLHTSTRPKFINQSVQSLSFPCMGTSHSWVLLTSTVLHVKNVNEQEPCGKSPSG